MESVELDAFDFADDFDVDVAFFEDDVFFFVLGGIFACSEYFF